MYSLEEARIKVKEQQAKMYELTKSVPSMEIFKARYALEYIYSNMSAEDRATLMNEVYNDLTGGK